MGKRTTLILCLLLAFTGVQGQVLENFSGEFIKEIKPLKMLPTRGACALYLEGNILYGGAGNVIFTADVSDPMNPKKLSETLLYGQTRQITVQNGYLYAACRESGAWVVDVHDPTDIKVVTRFDTVELATGMEVAGDVMFLGTRQNGVEFVDISDPTNPTHIRMEKTHESQSVTYRDGILYSGEWGAHCITVFDSRDMENVKKIREVNLMGHGDGVWTLGNYLYAATGHHLARKDLPKEETEGNGHGLEILDISDPTDPKPLSRVSFDHCYVRSNDFWHPRPCSDGDYVLVADTYNGLYVVDSHDKKDPQKMARLSFTDWRGNPAAVTCLAICNGVAYIGVSGNCGYYALRCPDAYPSDKGKGTPPLNASYRYSYPTSATSHFRAWKPEHQAPVRDVAAYEDIVFAACSYGGLAILKKGGKTGLKQIASGPMPYAGGVKVSGDILWVAEGFDGLGGYRIAKDGSLSPVARFKNFYKHGPNAACLWVSVPNEKWVAASTRDGGYYYIDVTDLSNLKCKAYLGSGPGWDKYLADKADSRGWFPATRHRVGICWINLNEEKMKETIDKGLNVSLADGVCAFRYDSFLTCTNGRVYIYSSKYINTGAKSPEPGKKEFYGMPTWDGGRNLALTRRLNKEISLADVPEDYPPLLLWSESTTGYPETPIFWKKKLLVPCGYQGLLIQK
ncbi:MAG: hypothetical protein J5835_02930 [Bacteroidales bacterium]|nr:hypothetical protein [Bacteroidales bacterium]